ncbi:MAG: FAD-dependent oxidoreductase, partial [Casimicrobiaceae bacterium]
MMPRHFEVIVVGGGLVGAAIAFGMRDLGAKLAVFDEGDSAHRAARGNFGLIWVQGKGLSLPPYGTWTQRSARAWPHFAAVLRDETGIDVALRQQGGLHVCLSQRELDLRAERFAQLFAQPGFERYEVEVLDRAAVARRLPGVGPDVVGGTWSALDGDCNPL